MQLRTPRWQVEWCTSEQRFFLCYVKELLPVSLVSAVTEFRDTPCWLFLSLPLALCIQSSSTSYSISAQTSLVWSILVVCLSSSSETDLEYSCTLQVCLIAQGSCLFQGRNSLKTFFFSLMFPLLALTSSIFLHWLSNSAIERAAQGQSLKKDLDSYLLTVRPSMICPQILQNTSWRSSSLCLLHAQPLNSL